MISGRIKTLPNVLYIPGLVKNLVSISKMNDAGVKTIFKKDNCKMVQGALILTRGVHIRNLYKLLLGSIVMMGAIVMFFLKVE